MRPKHLLLFVIGLTLVSCKTYYIPVDSFKQQLSGPGNSKLKEVTTKDPWGHTVTYKTYPIDSIRCVDKNGNPFALKNGPSLEIRFTDNDNNKTIFYFDRIFLERDTVVGMQSRILSIKKAIPLNSVKTIEIQDGQKKYSYVN